MTKRRIVFIINPISGTGSKEVIPSLIERHIDKEAYDVEMRFTEYANHASEITTQCKEDGVDIVVAVGGDGTVNEVARALVDSPTALGIIPCGSGNGLARHLMLPMNVKGAIDIINVGLIHELDYGVINEHPFFCTCGMGFDAFISKKFADAGKRGMMTYLENVLREGLKYEPDTYELTIDGNDTKQYQAFLLSVANASQYGNDAYIAPQASMSDGLLDVVIMEPFDILEAPQVGIELMNKTLDKSSRIKYFKAKDIKIRRSKPGVIHYDGDPVEAGTELHVAIHNKGIRVVVNPLADKKRRRPNMMQTAFSEIFNDLNIVREEVVTNPVKRVKAINNYIQNKLS
ncbi:MAG: diacylglycerol kinase family lipid kinase [Prevotella sp.]|nr:diacylglycerol kinase family lipid kinase [Prevotella sp.]MBR1839452.1 diacylglycerol kinase family lipid kinase [Prevotella sp.]